MPRAAISIPLLHSLAEELYFGRGALPLNILMRRPLSCKDSLPEQDWKDQPRSGPCYLQCACFLRCLQIGGISELVACSESGLGLSGR